MSQFSDRDHHPILDWYIKKFPFSHKKMIKAWDEGNSKVKRVSDNGWVSVIRLMGDEREDYTVHCFSVFSWFSNTRKSCKTVRGAGF